VSTNSRPQHGDISLDALAEDVGNLRDMVLQQGARDTLQQRAFDQLYAELKQYKEDFVFQMEKPLLLDLLLFHDSLAWFRQSLSSQEMSPEVVADSFQYLVDEFLELLYRRDVTPLEGRPEFDREIHKVVKVVPVGDAAQDYKVQQVVKRGFARGGRILRAEEVVVFRHQPAPSDDPRQNSR
jgi:molecular chaperone GrpE (heat shock protein)